MLSHSFFYKNLIFGISIFAYNAFCAFSGQYIYEDTYMTLYNVIFTSVLPLIIGMFDRDMDRPWALKYPGIYKQGGCDLSCIELVSQHISLVLMCR